MRTLIALAASLYTLCVIGQDQIEITAPEPYERIAVVELDSVLSSDEIYARSKRWFVDYFRDANEVIQLDDPVGKVIVGKGNWIFNTTILSASAVRKGRMRFSIEIAAKEGRYRVRFYDYRHEGTTGMPGNYGGIRTAGGPALNLGLILNDKDHCTDGLNHNGNAPAKHLARVCQEEVMPQIAAAERDILISLLEVMSRVSVNGDKRGTSDW